MFIHQNGFLNYKRFNDQEKKREGKSLDSESSRNIFIFFILRPTLGLLLIVVFRRVAVDSKEKKKSLLIVDTVTRCCYENWVQEHF